MANVIVLGIEGQNGLWVADLDAGTVTAIEPPSGGDLKGADDLRKAGGTITSGVNLAVRAKSAASVSGGFMDG